MTSALATFNQLPTDRAVADLLACCASPEWAHAVAAGRPYPDIVALTAAAGDVLARLDWSEISLALAAHPRIGERPAGAGREATWSRREQAGVDHAGGPAATQLAEANRAYERRFGHVFLIFASGRSDREIIANVRQRLGNDEDSERSVVRIELAKIMRLRLERLLA